MSCTRQFQHKFDVVVSMIEEVTKQTGISLHQVIDQACRDATMPTEFKHDILQSKNIADAFNWIRVYSTWYQADLLWSLSHLLTEGGFVEDYLSILQKYFKHRAASLPTTKGEEMFFVRIDSAWDAEALRGDQCIASCKQIAAILQKQGQVTGTFHKPYLFISIR